MTYKDLVKKGEDEEEGQDIAYLKARDASAFLLGIKSAHRVFFSSDTPAGIFTEIKDMLESNQMKDMEGMKVKNFAMDEETWALSFNVD